MGFFKKLFRKKEETQVENEINSLSANEKNVAENEVSTERDLSKIVNKMDISQEEEEKIFVENENIENLEKIEENNGLNMENTEYLEEKVSEKIEENIEEKSQERKGFFVTLKEKLFKSREGLFGTLKNLIYRKNVIDEELYEELEEILIQSDIGMDMTIKIVKELEKEVKKRGVKEGKDVYYVLKDVMKNFLIMENGSINLESGLNVILVVGVNGVGKTTTIGKLASKYKKNGKKVILGAADTFRAAAVEQLEEWAKRADVDIVKGNPGADPGAVVFDTLTAAESRGADVAIIDTAGRLHNKNNLMKELGKIHSIIKRRLGDKKYESILVIDGTTGQNALTQAKVFNEVTELTGFIITKLDGTAKGGIVFSISEELKKPIKFIGVGEQIEDLREFDSKEYIEAIFD